MDLLSDLAQAGPDGLKAAEVQGMDKAIGRLARKNALRGFTFEVQCTADLQRRGYAVQVVNERTAFSEDLYVPKSPTSSFQAHYHTDIDVVAIKNGKRLNFQCKSSAIALNGGIGEYTTAEAARKLHNWIGAAIAKDGIGSVRIMVPPGVVPDEHILEVLKRYQLDWNAIKVFSSSP